TDLRICPVTDLARDHERNDSRNVGLVREYEQVVHQLQVILVRIRNSRRSRRHCDVGVGLFDSRLLYPALDLPNAFEVVAHSVPVMGTEFLLQISGLLRKRVEDTAVLLFVSEALRGT